MLTHLTNQKVKIIIILSIGILTFGKNPDPDFTRGGRGTGRNDPSLWGHNSGISTTRCMTRPEASKERNHVRILMRNFSLSGKLGGRTSYHPRGTTGLNRDTFSIFPLSSLVSGGTDGRSGGTL